MKHSWSPHEPLMNWGFAPLIWWSQDGDFFPLAVSPFSFLPSLVFRHGPSQIEFHWNFVFSEPGPIYSWFFNSKIMFLATTLHSWLLMNFTARKFFYSWTYSWILPGPLMITHETPGHYFWGATIHGIMGSNLWNARFWHPGPPLPASGSEVPGIEKIKFIGPIDPPGVVTSGFPVKNYTGFCYRAIFIID